jgi:hypothetical protein
MMVTKGLVPGNIGQGEEARNWLKSSYLGIIQHILSGIEGTLNKVFSLMPFDLSETCLLTHSLNPSGAQLSFRSTASLIRNFVEGMKDGVFSLITTGHICFNSFFNLPALAILSSHDCWWEAVLEQQTKLRNNTFDFSQSKAASLWK